MTRQLSGTTARAARRLKPGETGHNESATRRQAMLAWMRQQSGSVRGDQLAKHFQVSRQCVVQDIAILRAGGEEIVATPQGYRLPQTASHAHRAILACRHAPADTAEELQILVDNGVKILDVFVEHPIYGELRGNLMIESRTDVADFLKKVKTSKAVLLSSLTRGVHLHTVESSRLDMIERATALLKTKGFLLK